MKTLFSGLITCAAVVSTTPFANASIAKNGKIKAYGCGNTRYEWYSEYVVLNSPAEYDGPGKIESCRQQLTDSGVTYVCHITPEKTALN